MQQARHTSPFRAGLSHLSGNGEADPAMLPSPREQRACAASVGRGWGWGLFLLFLCCKYTPTPSPSPQGGGEHTEFAACVSPYAMALPLRGEGCSPRGACELAPVQAVMSWRLRSTQPNRAGAVGAIGSAPCVLASGSWLHATWRRFHRRLHGDHRGLGRRGRLSLSRPRRDAGRHRGGRDL